MNTFQDQALEKVRRPDENVLGKLNFGAALLLLLGLFAVLASASALSWTVVGVTVIWALATFSGGILLGLIFGIPRMTQSPGQRSDAAGRLLTAEINNNLIEVSDWLTKILVGLGLVELRHLPEIAQEFAAPLASAVPGEMGKALALGVIYAYAIGGLIVGYVNSRTAIALLIKQSDTELTRVEVQDLADAVKATALIAQTKVAGLQAAAGAQPLPTPQKLVNLSSEYAQLARRYEAIENPDYKTRVALKDRAAAEIFKFGITHAIPKATLVEWARDLGDGGIVGYATRVIADGDVDDFDRLIEVGKRAKWLHTKFRIVTALQELLRAGLSPHGSWDGVRRLIAEFSQQAIDRGDRALLNKTHDSQVLIDAITNS